jgi:phage-related holin
MPDIAYFTKSVQSTAGGLLHVFTTKKTLLIAAAIGSAWAAFKAAFIRDHVISFDLTMALAYMVLMDTVLGLWMHFKNKKASSKGFAAFFTKLLMYWCVLKVANWLSLIPLLGLSGDIIISAMMVREAISIAENIEGIQAGIIPRWIVKRLEDFDDDGEVNKSNTSEVQPQQDPGAGGPSHA